MVKLPRSLCFLFVLISPLFADISVESSSVNLSGAQAQQIIGKLGTTLDQVFYGVASLAGPGIVNSAAFSSTIGSQRQQDELPFFQLESSVGVILPSETKGDERLNSLPLYAVNLVGGFRLNEKTAIQMRGFYLPEIPLTVKQVAFSVQPFNFGLTLTRQVKKIGKAWYDPAIITPLDFGYMHGSLSANFQGSKDFKFDPVGDGSKEAEATLSYRDEFKLKWDVYTVTTGIILVRPFFSIFTARVGILSSLHMGLASLSNTATGSMVVNSGGGTGANEFENGDTATVTARNSARFKPILVSNQITLGLGIQLGAAALNVDLSQNLQINATAIVVQLGCWF